ncbi:MAG: lysylphosphatidylglycerol synthase transmembrane domain-containing protein [Deltaproteobacteria bacterium]|nr:lysylphosphatidylglycerol synthase transmembrane domain-containing protein [Deltaproteobacteria bacterium]
MAAGILIGGLLLYFSVRGIDFGAVLDTLGTVHVIYIVPILTLYLLVQFLRSYRWGILLKPIKEIDQASLFSITSVGFLAILAVPARVGELVRPFLLSRKSDVTMASALGTIFIERIFDVLTILAILFFLIPFAPIPGWLSSSGMVSLSLVLAVMAVIIPRFTRERAIRILGKLPARLRLLHNWAVQFDRGLSVMSSTGQVLLVFVLSLTIWLLQAFSLYILFLAFNFSLPPQAALVLLVVIIIGIAVPAAPGFIGNWHFACVAALALFGIPKNLALSYAILSHFLGTIMCIFLGLMFLPANKISFRDLDGIRTLLKGGAK